MRGLKFFDVNRVVFVFQVASFMDAWIEIQLQTKMSNAETSHPLWMRGLKLFERVVKFMIDNVASFMDAWIEISNCRCSSNNFDVASFMDAWIEIAIWYRERTGNGRRILYGCVD